ncbi:MAG: GTPase ObgE [Rickettsiales bacterium]
MRIIDEVKIILISGKGGNGCTSFRREKFIEFGGPDGGNGGSGGNIILKGNKAINTLGSFRYKKRFEAESGKSGSGANKTGKSGEDLIIEVPIGTQIFSEEENILLYDIKNHDEEIVILKGGKGGAGNACFKSSINQSPEFAIPGEEGQELTIWLKLKILSDVGIIGLPNAGKSTFLSIVSNAKPKIADFPFTTISPNLGMVSLNKDKEVAFCDIPGLIEGAHLGHGLGDKFLKHIERCKILLHLIDISSEDIINDFNIIMQELALYSANLLQVPMIIVLNKIDILHDEAKIEEKVKQLKKHLSNNLSFELNDGSKVSLQFLQSNNNSDESNNNLNQNKDKYLDKNNNKVNNKLNTNHIVNDKINSNNNIESNNMNKTNMNSFKNSSNNSNTIILNNTNLNKIYKISIYNKADIADILMKVNLLLDEINNKN